MKKNHITVFLLAILIAFSSCTNNSVKEPDQIGKQVFEILKKISIDSKHEYVGKFLSIEEIRELGKNEEIVKDEKTRNEMTSMLKDKWVGRIESDYNRIKEKAGQYGINWQEIEYLDFVYELEEDDGLKICKGELYFKYNDQSFKIDVRSIHNGNEYKLTEIEDFYEQ